jgi:hypothetical protein
MINSRTIIANNLKKTPRFTRGRLSGCGGHFNVQKTHLCHTLQHGEFDKGKKVHRPKISGWDILGHFLESSINKFQPISAGPNRLDNARRAG